MINTQSETSTTNKQTNTTIFRMRCNTIYSYTITFQHESILYTYLCWGEMSLSLLMGQGVPIK